MREIKNHQRQGDRNPLVASIRLSNDLAASLMNMRASCQVALLCAVTDVRTGISAPYCALQPMIVLFRALRLSDAQPRIHEAGGAELPVPSPEYSVRRLRQRVYGTFVPVQFTPITV